MGKIDKCYCCNLPIVDPNNHVKLKAPLKTKKDEWRWRNFHKVNDNGLECHIAYFKNIEDKAARKIENDEFVELCEYVRCEVLQQKDSLSKYMVRRLMGAYNDEFIAKGINTRGQKDKGYSYELILRAFKIQKNKIQNHLSITDIKDEKHRSNSIMMFIWPKQLPHLKRQLEAREKAKKKAERILEPIDVSGSTIADYTQNKKETPKEIDDTGFWDDL